MSKAVTFHHMVEFVEEGNIFYLYLNIHDFRCAPLPCEEIKNITYKPVIVYTTKRPYLDEMKFMFTNKCNHWCCSSI